MLNVCNVVTNCYVFINIELCSLNIIFSILEFNLIFFFVLYRSNSFNMLFIVETFLINAKINLKRLIGQTI